MLETLSLLRTEEQLEVYLKILVASGVSCQTCGFFLGARIGLKDFNSRGRSFPRFP